MYMHIISTKRQQRQQTASRVRGRVPKKRARTEQQRPLTIFIHKLDIPLFSRANVIFFFSTKVPDRYSAQRVILRSCTPHQKVYLVHNVHHVFHSAFDIFLKFQPPQFTRYHTICSCFAHRKDFLTKFNVENSRSCSTSTPHISLT